MTEFLALVTAVGYGTSGFLGGLAATRRHAAGVVAWSQLLGLPVLAVGIAVVPAPGVAAGDLALGAAAGLASLLGLTLMYQALAAGRMAVAAPVAGAVGATGPVIVDLAAGNGLSRPQTVGIVLAVAAILVVGAERLADLGDPVVGKALLAGAFVAAFFVALHATGEDAGLVPLLGTRAVTVPLGLLVAARNGAAGRPARSEFAPLAAIGVVDMTATVAIALALQHGPLGVSSVLASLSPAVTVVLAAVVRRERPTTRQWIGVAAAVVAVALLSL
ncbi:MAG TPA: EamA family transporter [Actinobacteria bacterium]|nr:EamA family transporter [Actinomycetota bacterium]